MELIRKSDALNAVLHHHGDAAVEAVQGLDGVEIVILEWCDQKTPEKKWQEYRVLVRNMPTIDDVERGECEERINPHGELREILIDEMIDEMDRKEQTEGRQ